MTTRSRTVILAAVLSIVSIAMVAGFFWGITRGDGRGPIASAEYGVARTESGLFVFNCGIGGVGSVNIDRGGLNSSDSVWRAEAQPGSEMRSNVPVASDVEGFDVEGSGVDSRTGAIYLSSLQSTEGRSVLHVVVEFDEEDLEVGNAMTGIGLRSLAGLAAEYPSCLP